MNKVVARRTTISYWFLISGIRWCGGTRHSDGEVLPLKIEEQKIANIAEPYMNKEAGVSVGKKSYWLWISDVEWQQNQSTIECNWERRKTKIQGSPLGLGDL